MKKASVILVLLVLAVTGYLFYQQRSAGTGANPGPEVYVKYTSEQLQQRLDKGEKPILVDVRLAYEYGAGHIPGAVNIPLGQLKNRVTELDKDKEIIFVCHDGPMGDMAAEYLLEEGFAKVGNLNGGMGAWTGPLEKK